MILVNSNRGVYRFPTSFDEVRIEQVKKFGQINVPEKLRKLMVNPTNENVEAITDAEFESDVLPFYRKAVGVLADIPHEDLRLMTDEQIGNFFAVIMEMVNELVTLNFASYEARRRTMYTLHGVLRPLTVVEGVVGLDLPIKAYCEAADLIQVAGNGNTGALIYLPGVLNSKPERWTLKLPKRWAKKPFTRVLDFFFSSLNSITKLILNLSRHFRGAKESRSKQPLAGLFTKQLMPVLVVFLN